MTISQRDIERIAQVLVPRIADEIMQRLRGSSHVGTPAFTVGEEPESEAESDARIKAHVESIFERIEEKSRVSKRFRELQGVRDKRAARAAEEYLGHFSPGVSVAGVRELARIVEIYRATSHPDCGKAEDRLVRNLKKLVLRGNHYRDRGETRKALARHSTAAEIAEQLFKEHGISDELRRSLHQTRQATELAKT